MNYKAEEGDTNSSTSARLDISELSCVSERAMAEFSLKWTRRACLRAPKKLPH